MCYPELNQAESDTGRISQLLVQQCVAARDPHLRGLQSADPSGKLVVGGRGPCQSVNRKIGDSSVLPVLTIFLSPIFLFPFLNHGEY